VDSVAKGRGRSPLRAAKQVVTTVREPKGRAPSGSPAARGGQAQGGRTRPGLQGRRPPEGRVSPKPARGRTPGAAGRHRLIAPEVTGAARRWGGVARRGARQLAQVPRRAGQRKAPSWPLPSAPPPPPPVWVPADAAGAEGGWSRGSAPTLRHTREVGGSPKGSTAPKPRRGGSQAPALPLDVAAAIDRALPGASRRQVDQLRQRAIAAANAYDRGRFEEAAALGRSLARALPTVAPLRRLAGLAAYRSERWRAAIGHLEAFRRTTSDLTAALEVVPLLMDCYRALGRRQKVSELFTELRQASPPADTMAEARIVAASARADDGALAEAVSLLTTAGAARKLRNPAARHIRQWYVLGDLYERAGDLPRAREFFSRVQRADPEAYDVEARLEALGR